MSSVSLFSKVRLGSVDLELDKKEAYVVFIGDDKIRFFIPESKKFIDISEGETKIKTITPLRKSPRDLKSFLRLEEEALFKL